MTSLYTRLSIAFLFILLALGAFIVWDSHRSSQQYFLEFTQRLNSPIAMYMAENAQLIDAQGLDQTALENLAGHVMVINPSAEVYLLNQQGEVAAHAFGPGDIQQPRVALEPVRQFLSGNAPFPLLGDNPRHATEQRIFSVHPLAYQDRLFGYVYVILAGEQHENLLASISSSHTYKSMAFTIACAVLLAILAGFLLFFKLTRRLQGLTDTVLTWQDDLPQSSSPVGGRAALAGDEIDQLGEAYSDMAYQLIDQNAQLLKNDKERREFYANISHDLRTPLTTMQGYLETILLKQRDLTDRQQRKHLETALKQSQRLQHLITQLFDLNRLTSDHYKLNLEDFSLLELSYDIVQDFAPLAEKKSVNLQVRQSGQRNDSLTVRADIALIQRVFENLIDNALRYTPANGVITIELNASAADRIEVSVSDTGIGMSSKATGKIFDRHYSPDINVAQDDEHAGLGLSIVNHIVGLHGSKVSIESAPGKGTCFSFFLSASSHSGLGPADQLPQKRFEVA